MVGKGGTTTVDADLRASEPEPPPLDPGAIDRAYRLHRARRRARVRHLRETKRAGARFWLVLLVLVAAIVALGVFIAQQVQQLFGI